MKVFITNSNNKEHLVKAFEEAGAEMVSRYECLDSSVKLIVPTVDEEAWFFSRSRDWFHKQGIRVLMSSENTIQMCRDKAEFYRFCRRHSFSVPETMQGEFVAKNRWGKGGRGQMFIDRSYIVQEICDWPEYSIDYVANFDGNVASVIARKRLNVINGESHAAEFCEDEILISEAKRLGRELMLCGHNVMQCFYDGKRIKWLEVNTRYGGGSWLTFEKFNSPKFFVDLISKEAFMGKGDGVPMPEVPKA